MRNAILIVLTVIIALVLANSVIAPTSEEASASASVTVNEFVDITITDRGAAGINFGGLDPGTNNNPEAAQTVFLGAINFTVQSTTNKNPVNVKLSGTDFSAVGNPNITISNVAADDDSTVDGGDGVNAAQISLSTAFQTLKTLSPASSQEIWYWLDVPSGQAAATYASTFSFRGD